MSHLIDPPKSLPPPGCVTGLGWLLQAALLESGGKNRAGAPAACFPAQQRRSGREAFIASAVFGVWSFLAVGALLMAHAGVMIGVVLWLPVWLLYVHAVTLLPPLLILPLPSWAPRGQDFVVHAMLLLTAWLLLASPWAPCRWLGVFWVAVILLESGLRLLRVGLRLATRAN